MNDANHYATPPTVIYYSDVGYKPIEVPTKYQAQCEYKRSLTFRVRCHVVIATKSMHRLQIRPKVHN